MKPQFFLWALVALFVSFTSAKAQVFNTADLQQYDVVSTLYVTTFGGVTRVSSSEHNIQFAFAGPATEFSLWTGPADGVVTISDSERQESLPFIDGPIVATVNGNASITLGSVQVVAGQSLVLSQDSLSLRNFILHIGDGDSAFTLKSVKFEAVPEPEHFALAGAALIGFGVWRSRWCRTV